METYEQTQLRVKLYKKGLSHDDITKIFETVPIEDLTNHRYSKIASKCVELLDDRLQNRSNLINIIENLITTLIDNNGENNTIINIATKDLSGNWSAHTVMCPYTIKEFNVVTHDDGSATVEAEIEQTAEETRKKELQKEASQS